MTRTAARLTSTVCLKISTSVPELQDRLTEMAQWFKRNTHIAMEEGPVLGECLNEQAADGDCQATVQTVRHAVSCYSYAQDEIVVRKAPIYGAL